MMIRRFLAVAVLLTLGTPAVVGAQQGTVKGRGSAKVIFGTPKCGTPEGMKRGQPIPECAAPSPADIANAERRAGLNAIERLVSDEGIERVNAFDRAKETILERLDEVVMSTTELSRNVDPTSRTLQLVVSAEINQTRLAVFLQNAQAASGSAVDMKRNKIASFMVARAQGSITSFLEVVEREASDNSDVQRVATTDRSGNSRSNETSSDEEIAGRAASDQRNSQVTGRDQVSQNVQVQGTNNSQARGTNNSRAQATDNSRASATDNSTEQESGSARVQTSERGDATFDQTKTKNVQRSEDLSDPSRSSSDTRKVQSTTASGTANYEGSANVSAQGQRNTTYDGTRSSASDATRNSSFDATRNSSFDATRNASSDASLNSSRASNSQINTQDSAKRVVNRSAASDYSASTTDMAGENVSRSTSSRTAGSNTRQADKVTYNQIPADPLESVLRTTLTQGKYEIMMGAVVAARGGDAKLMDDMRVDYGTGGDLKAETLIRLADAAMKAKRNYMIVGSVDLTLPEVDNISGDKRVYAMVSATVYELDEDGIPTALVTVGPAQYAGLGNVDAVAQLNALKNAGGEVARRVLDGLNNR